MAAADGTVEELINPEETGEGDGTLHSGGLQCKPLGLEVSDLLCFIFLRYFAGFFILLQNHKLLLVPADGTPSPNTKHQH